MKDASGLPAAAASGRQAAWNALNQQNSSPPAQSGPHGGGETQNAGAPAWASAMRADQTARHQRQLAVHALSQGDKGGGSTMPDIKEKDD
jgi:type IV secretion system protein TrbL